MSTTTACARSPSRWSSSTERTHRLLPSTRTAYASRVMRHLFMACILAAAAGGGVAPESSSPPPPPAPVSPSNACPSDPAALATDAHHCGACGHDCLGGACAAGACQPVVLVPALGEKSVHDLVVDE